MEPSVPGTDGISQPVPGVVDTTQNQTPPVVAPLPQPITIHLPSGPVVSGSSSTSSQGTGMVAAKIAFVATLLVLAAVLMILGFEVGAILALFAGVGLLAIELLKRL